MRRQIGGGGMHILPRQVSEWEAPEMAQLGFAKVLVNYEVRKIHDAGVMEHLIKGPYIMFFQPMMEEPGWRKYL